MMSNYTANKIVNDPNHSWNKVISLIPSNSMVLDVGCSSGNMGQSLIKNKHCIVDGIELDSADADIAKQKLRRVWVGSIEDKTITEGIKSKYDVIIFADVLEHLINPVDTLKRLKTLTKSRGSIVFSMPNMAHVSVRLALIKGDFSYTETGVLDKTHLRFYNRNSIEQLFTDAGMSITQLTTSEYPYTDSLIAKKLKQSGLSVSQKGLKTLHKSDATAFQFIGEAKYVQARQKPKVYSLNKQAIHNDVQLLSQELVLAQAETKSLSADLKKFQMELNSIKNSRSYRIVHTGSKLYSKLKRLRKSI